MSDDYEDELKAEIHKRAREDRSEEREEIENMQENVKGMLSGLLDSTNESQDIKQEIKKYLNSFGVPDGSLKSDRVLKEIANHQNIAYESVDQLKEAIEDIKTDGDLIAEMVNNNLQYFGDE